MYPELSESVGERVGKYLLLAIIEAFFHKVKKAPKRDPIFFVRTGSCLDIEPSARKSKKWVERCHRTPHAL